MLQTRTARWVVLTAFACVAVLTAAWFLLVSPRRAEAADIRDRTDAAAAQNDALELKVAQLKAQFATLATNKAELAKVLEQLPPGAGTPELVRSLDTMATESGTILKSVTPGAAAYLPTTATSTGTAGAAGSTDTTAAAGAAASGTAGSGTAGSGTAAGSAASSKIVSIPLIVVVHGDYFQTVVFLKKLQTEMPRAFLVSSLQVSKGTTTGTATATGPGTANGTGTATGTGTTGTVDLTISGKVFALLGMDDAATAATGSTASGGTGTSTGSGTGTSGTSGTSGSGSTGSGSRGAAGSGTAGAGTTNALGGTFSRGTTAATRPAEDS